jgi:predicted nucleic acid-binding protein
VIETEGGDTVVLMTEEFIELAKNLTREDFQALMLDSMRKQCERVMTLELVKAGLIRELKELQKDVKDLEKKVARLEELLRQPAVN